MSVIVRSEARRAAALVKIRQEQQTQLRDIYVNDCAKWIEERANGFLYGKTREIADSVVKHRRTAVPSAHDIGKHLCVETLLPSPNGWIKMGDVEIGQELYDEQGFVCKVIAKTEIEERETYRVRFSDGTYIDASDVHLWNVHDLRFKGKTKRYDWRDYWDETVIKTTEELSKSVVTNNNQRRWSIPNTKAIQGTEHWMFRWNPYTYGCWLGDGTTTEWNMTCSIDDTKHFALMTDSEYSRPKNRNDIVKIHFPGRPHADCPAVVYNKPEKFIHPKMLRASYEDRLELLRGLMDTDGYLTSGRNVEVDLSVQSLAMDVVELIRSLGWIARWTKCNGKEGKRSYRITFTPDENPFHLPRKALLWAARDIATDRMRSRTTKKTIVSIEPIGIKKVRCIEVDSNRRLYLAGKGFIPTHNSWIAARIAAWWIAVHPPGSAFVITTAPTNKQVKAVLWKEMRRVYVAAKLTGRLNQTEWWINNEMVAMGRKPNDYDPTAFQGIHAKYVLVIIDEGCHDKDTEVLTRDGWKKFSDVTLNDEFLSMNPETEIAEYVKAVRIIDKPYEGDMYTYTSRGANYKVTPDHRMYHSTYSYYSGMSEWRFSEAQDIRSKQNEYFRRDINWKPVYKEYFKLPAFVGKKAVRESQYLPMDYWAAFLGWYCSEGSLTYRNNQAYVVQITQKNQQNLDEIEEICRLLEFNYSRYSTSIHIFDVQLADYLSRWGRYCTEKRIPEEIRMADVDRINIFLDAYVKGDGYTHKGIDTIYTSCYQMAADLQEIILKSGVDSTVRKRSLVGIQSDLGTHIATSSVDGYVVTRCNASTKLKYRPSNLRLEPYNDNVYCVTLEKYGLLMTRRDGYALWSGNCGVTESIYVAANSLIANEFGRMLVIGNPDDPDSHFAKVCKPGSGWNVIPVSVFDTPNFTGIDAPQEVKDVLVSQIYVDEMRRDVGEDSPVYKAKVLGQFPDTKLDGVIPYYFIQQCIDANVEDEPKYTPDDLLPVEMGVDVGAGGDDTSLRIRFGPLVGPGASLKTPKPEEAFELIVRYALTYNVSRVKIDSIGLGWGLLGMFAAAQMRGKHYNEILGEDIDISRIEFIGVNVSQRSTDPERFPRLRDQLWWEVGRELSRTQGWDLTGIDEKTVGQLTDPTWKPDLAGRHKVESKHDTMKRTGRGSPNEADALLLAYCVPPMPEQQEFVVYHDPVEIGPRI